MTTNPKLMRLKKTMQSFGLSRTDIRKLVACGIIRRIHIAPGGKGFYDPDEISSKIHQNGNHPK